MNISPDLPFHIEDQFSQRFGIFGMSGSGKSNSLRTFLEEIVLSGQPIPMTVVDPEDEYWSLKEIGSFICVGEEAHADVPCDSASAPMLAQYSVEQGVSVILSLSHLNDGDAQEFLSAYLTGLWKAQSRKRRPYLLAVEEAHEFAHQKKPGAAKDTLIRLAKRGRKKGLILLVSTQRPAALDKDIVTQLTTLFLHRVAYPSDIAIYKEVVPLKSQETERLVQSLTVGQAIVVREGGQVDTAQVRRATTFDAGATPGLYVEDLPQLREVVPSLIDELRGLLRTNAPVPDPEKVELRRRIGELEQVVRDKDEALILCDEFADNLLSELAALRATGGNGHSMHVDAIHAREITIASMGGVEAGSSVAAETAPGQSLDDDDYLLDEIAEQRKQKSVDVATARQRGKFNGMLDRIGIDVTKAWRDAFAYLLRFEHERFTLKDLSRHRGFALNTLAMFLPHYLFERNLVGREGRGESAIYWSTARATLTEEFPGLDIEDMLRELSKAVTPRGRK